jgi:hypothetical protein
MVMDLRELRRLRNAYAKARLREEEKREGRGYQRRVADAVGYSTAHVANYMTSDIGAAGPAAERIAHTMWGLDTIGLDRLAAEYAKTAPTESQIVDDAGAPLDKTADGRWRGLAAKNDDFRREATAARAAGHSEHTLDLASDLIGEQKGALPLADVKQAIRTAIEAARGYAIAELPVATTPDPATTSSFEQRIAKGVGTIKPRASAPTAHQPARRGR